MPLIILTFTPHILCRSYLLGYRIILKHMGGSDKFIKITIKLVSKMVISATGIVNQLRSKITDNTEQLKKSTYILVY